MGKEENISDRKTLITYYRDPFSVFMDHDNSLCTGDVTIRQAVRLVTDGKMRDFPSPTVCIVDGVPVLRKDWDIERSCKNIVFFTVPLGRGGGGSDPLRTILSLLVFAAAFAGGAPLAAVLGFTGQIAAGVATAVIGLAGNALIGAILPPPKAHNADRLRELGEGSPTYAIGNEGNFPRLYSAIPVIYGRMRVFPDYIAHPYSVYSIQFHPIGNDRIFTNRHVFYQIFMLGWGEFDVEGVYFNSGNVNKYDQVISYVRSDGSNVLVDRIAYESGLLKNVTLLGKESDSSDILWEESEVINPVGTFVFEVQVNVLIRSDGEYGQVDLQYKDVGDDGYDLSGALSDWRDANIDAETIRLFRNFNNVQSLFSLKFRLNSRGRIKVRVGQPIVGVDTHICHSCVAFVRLNVPSSYTTLQTSIEVDEQIASLSSRRYSAVVRRILSPPPNTSGGSDFTVSSLNSEAISNTDNSLAWVLYDMLHNSDYGAGLSDDQIDLDVLHELQGQWVADRFQFNGVFDRRESFWDALRSVARCGRAVPIIKGGKVSFVRDRAVGTVSALFTMNNIIKDSFKVTYSLADGILSDKVIVEFFNSASWSPDEVQWHGEGEDTSQVPVRVKFFGCTDRDHALSEARYIFNSNKYRRQRVLFMTEYEGRLPSYGSLIRVSHDIPSWGETLSVSKVGDVVENGVVLHLRQHVSFREGSDHVVVFKMPNGGASDVISCRAGSNNKEIVVSQVPSRLRNSEEDISLVFGVVDNVARDCRVVGLKPVGLDRVELSAVIEDSRVYGSADIEAKVYTLVVDSDMSEIDVYANTNNYDGPIVYNIIVNSGAEVHGGIDASKVRHANSEVRIVNYGHIYGRGGNGAPAVMDGITQAGSWDGQNGGDAIICGCRLLLTNEGYIAGGGGGGGAGAVVPFKDRVDGAHYFVGIGGGGAGKPAGLRGKTVEFHNDFLSYVRRPVILPPAIDLPFSFGDTGASGSVGGNGSSSVRINEGTTSIISFDLHLGGGDGGNGGNIGSDGIRGGGWNSAVREATNSHLYLGRNFNRVGRGGIAGAAVKMINGAVLDLVENSGSNIVGDILR